MDTLTYLGKLMSYWLRHNPKDILITLDENGWTDLDTFIQNAGISRETIEHIVATCPKQRFTINSGKIRANQGHSVKLNIEFTEVTPPTILFHGTPSKVLGLIMQQGLKTMNRHHVHLSKDIETAKSVGGRRGEFKVLTIDAARMREDGLKFFISDNGVYLSDFVEPKYIIGVHS